MSFTGNAGFSKACCGSLCFDFCGKLFQTALSVVKVANPGLVMLPATLQSLTTPT